MHYLRNTWYAAAWDDEVKDGELFTRMLLNESILFFRDSRGQAKAISNRCAHRFAPLNLGKHCGDRVQCPYHGLEYDGAGLCVHNPQGDGSIPKAAKVKSYPLHERYSMLWIWMGDEALADAGLIPDFNCMDPEFNYVGKRYLHARANYVLETDNIMDLSHVEFLHPGTLGGDGVKHALTSISQLGNTVCSNRQTVAEIMPEFLYGYMQIASGTPVDRWIDVRWDPPASMLLMAGAVPTGEARTAPMDSPFLIPHLFSPETETTTHYWFAATRAKALGPGQEIVEQQVGSLNTPFTDEDLPMLEAQQKMMGSADFWSLKPILLPGDGGAVRARRVLDKLIAVEQAGGASGAQG